MTEMGNKAAQPGPAPWIPEAASEDTAAAEPARRRPTFRGLVEAGVFREPCAFLAHSPGGPAQAFELRDNGYTLECRRDGEKTMRTAFAAFAAGGSMDYAMSTGAAARARVRWDGDRCWLVLRVVRDHPFELTAHLAAAAAAAARRLRSN